MNVVLDTNVFIGICRGNELEGKVKSKIIRDCDAVTTNNKLVEEYCNVLNKFGLSDRIIFTHLALFDAHGKYRHGRERNINTELVTHEKDRHVIECALAYDAPIITHESKHLLNLREDMKDNHGVQIYSPEEYLRLPKQSKS